MSAKLVNDNTIEIINVQIINNERISVVYRKLEGFLETLPFGNLYLPIWITSAARSHLYHYIEETVDNGGEVLYYDTGKYNF